MSIDLDNAVDELILALATTVDSVDLYANPFILTQDSEPRQSDWEAAWVLAGNSLPISEDQELYWQAGDTIHGQFGRTNDRFYAIFPSNSVSIAEVVHFAYTKFLGWIDEQHFYISGTQLNASGQTTGLFKVYLDGTIVSTTFAAFVANTLLGFDELQSKLWYIQGTDLKRIDVNTSVITTIASGITVAPTEIAFDGAGDAFCTTNIGAGLAVYRWNNGALTFTSVKSTVTVNGASVAVGQVITASLNYVVVLTGTTNYWVQFARVGLAETRIKSSSVGASAANIPTPSATAWTQILAQRSLDVLSIVYTELSGTPGLGQWRRTILWNMATGTYTDEPSLPYDDFIDMCINEAPSAEILDARRDVLYHTLTYAYRKRVASAWEYHNIAGIRPNAALSRQILETDDGQIFVYNAGSSGKIWRISAWDYGESDAIVVELFGIPGSPTFDLYLANLPPGYDLIELSFMPAGSDGGAAARSAQATYSGTVPAPTGMAIFSDPNTYGSSIGPSTHTLSLNSLQGNLNVGLIFKNFLLGSRPDLMLMDGTLNNGVVNETVYTEKKSNYNTYPDPLTLNTFAVSGAGFSPYTGAYYMIRALRTEGRRQGASYYDPAMA